VGAVLALVVALLPGPAFATDMARILSAVVGLRAEVPEEARTAEGLGTQRTGSGVVIDARGLVLTVGYLVMEATHITVSARPGQDPDVPADFLAYDHATGLGLARAREPLDVTPMALGDSDATAVGSPVIVASYGGASHARPALLVDRREFAGYWEYLLEGALFTSPPHPLFGGAALIDVDGALIGIGSLMVNDARKGDEPVLGNMFIPVNALKPILGELLTTGRGPGPWRPWLGLHCEALDARVVVRRVSPDGPSERAGVMAGAIVTAVNDAPVRSLAGFYRAVWASGDAGATVRLTLLTPDGDLRDVAVESADRYGYLRLP
jgi:S1-C subfamily serine protease